MRLPANLHLFREGWLYVTGAEPKLYSLQETYIAMASGRLSGKVAVITGSSSGIGQGIALRFAAEGADVVINYRSQPDSAEETRAKAEQYGVRAIMVEADVSNISDTEKLIAETWKQLGGCDILVNNAGVEKHGPFLEVTVEDYDTVLDTNLKGAFFLTQAFVRKLTEAKKPGCVINISSVHEDMVFPNFSTYCASKGGMRMVMRDLAVELGPLGVRVNNIAPGAISTPINSSLLKDKTKLDALLSNIPLGRMGTPDDVAGVAVFLASNDGGYITGSTFFVDGGLIRNYHEQ